jgi:hypothetical protein
LNFGYLILFRISTRLPTPFGYHLCKNAILGRPNFVNKMNQSGIGGQVFGF